MIDLFSDPAVWASLLTLTVLEIILGVDNVIFISIATSKLPPEHRARARIIGLGGALVLRIALLASIAWIVGLTEPFLTVRSFALSWRDLLLLTGGLFLIWKASNEIFREVEGASAAPHSTPPSAKSAFGAVVLQIIILDIVFSFDSVLTAVGIADDLPVMITAVIIAILVMMIAANPIGQFVEDHPSTKMLALAFLVMVGVALVADGLHHHFERAFIYAAMTLSGCVEALNLWRAKRLAHASAPPNAL